MGSEMAHTAGINQLPINHHARTELAPVLVPKGSGIKDFIQDNSFLEFVETLILTNESNFLNGHFGVGDIESNYESAFEHAKKHAKTPAPITLLVGNYGSKYEQKVEGIDAAYEEYVTRRVLDEVSDHSQSICNILLITEQRSHPKVQRLYIELKEKYPLMNIKTVS